MLCMVAMLCMNSGYGNQPRHEDLKVAADAKAHPVDVFSSLGEDTNIQKLLADLWLLLTGENRFHQLWADRILTEVASDRLALSEYLSMDSAKVTGLVDAFFIARFNSAVTGAEKKASMVYLRYRSSLKARRFVQSKGIPPLDELLKDVPIVDPRGR